ncbi:HAMP domain-containing sensor histidine kinase [Roseburia hominis]
MYTRSGELVIISGDKVTSKFIPKFIIRFLKSLHVRIAFLFSVVGILACIFLRGAILENYEQRAVSMRTAEIQNQCMILSNQLISSNYLKNTSSEVINAELTQLSNIYNGRVVVINDEFRIVKDTYNLQEGKTIVSEDVVRCYRGEQTSSYDEENNYIEVAVPITENGNKVRGMMLVSISADSVLEGVEALKARSRVVTAAVGVVLVIFSVLVGFFLVRPFKRITHTIEEMADGYEDKHLEENAYIETRQISEAFNKLWSRYRVIDASREEFVSNVSHELKTPLASVKVLADSLLAQPEAPVELYREFMGDVSEEIERENKIINDLLELVKLDKKGSNLSVESRDINELVERILKRLRPLAAKRNIELIFESFRPVTAEVDEVKMALVITNLVENAIKYNKEGGRVQVTLNADHKYFYLKVEDSGIGIPKEEMDNIFERFYRVDKSHSREIGGTGLGLSIARNAVVMHRGAIKVYSEPGEGTTFNVRIPLNYIAK